MKIGRKGILRIAEEILRGDAFPGLVEAAHEWIYDETKRLRFDVSRTQVRGRFRQEVRVDSIIEGMLAKENTGGYG